MGAEVFFTVQPMRSSALRTLHWPYPTLARSSSDAPGWAGALAPWQSRSNPLLPEESLTREGAIAEVLEPDVASAFGSSEVVNALLRSVNALRRPVAPPRNAIASISLVFGNEAPPAIGLALRRTPSQRRSQSLRSTVPFSALLTETEVPLPGT